MTANSQDRTADRIGLCSWSLQPNDPESLLEATSETGCKRVQLALNPLIEDPETWGSAPDLLAKHDIEIVSGMFGTAGEDYTTPQTIRETGGIVPDATWGQNWQHICRVADLATDLGLGLIMFHAGFIPEDPGSSTFETIRDRIERIAQLFGNSGIHLGMETGQETATLLMEFLGGLNARNVGVNFDPANMILYDKGDPIESLKTVRPRLLSCHIKDAVKPDTPGEWGTEMPVGQGEVDWLSFFAILEETDFKGDLVIEREHGEARVRDVRDARIFVEQILNQEN